MAGHRKGKDDRKLAVHGDWYIVERAGKLYRAKYDPVISDERRYSLGTSDLEEAKRKLAELVAAEYRPQQAAPSAVKLASVLVYYWDEHASNIVSAKQAKIELRFWAEWWGEATVDEVRLDRQKRFVEHLRGLGKSDGYISRIMATGRAALKHAYKHSYIASAPYVMDVEGAEEKRSKDPKGRPLSVEEVARLLDNIPADSEHLWRFCVLMLCTMARPDAVLDLTSAQVNREFGYINLLPKGRKQTRKRRGIVPICDTLRPWLDKWGNGPLPYVAYTKSKDPSAPRARSDAPKTVAAKPVSSVKVGWRALRARVWPADLSGLPEAETPAEVRRRRLLTSEEGVKVQPYSFRHTLGRALRRRRVPGDEISIMLGHLVVTENQTTGIYSPHDPDYCLTAKAALDDYLREVDRHMRGPRRLVLQDAPAQLQDGPALAVVGGRSVP